jgi:hypothetical protein
VFQRLRGRPPHAIMHIGVLFSDLANDTQLSFFGYSPDSIIAHELSIVTPPPAAAARLDSAPPAPHRRAPTGRSGASR